MKQKIIIFGGITAIIFGCCYIYHEVYPHIAGQLLISYYSDIKLVMSGRVPDGYSITPEQSAQMSQFIFYTHLIKIFLAFIFSIIGTIGILHLQKRIKREISGK